MGDSLGAGFWRMWTASGLSNLADGVLKVSLPLVAVQFTRSPTLIAGLAFALSVPWLLFALPVGALADRLDRRRMMLGVNAFRVAVLAVLTMLVLFDIGSIWILYVVAFGLGVAETVYDTAAQSLLPQLVGREQLPRANGRLFAVELAANGLAGKTLAGLLVAAGAAVAFGTPVVLWAVALVMLSLVRGRFRVQRSEPTTVRSDIAEGLRFLWRHRVLRALAAMVGGFNFASDAMMAVFVLYAVGAASPMGLSEAAYGVLMAVTALGGVCGSFVAERITRRLSKARGLTLSLLLSVPLVAAPAVSADPLVVGVGFFVGGAGLVVWNVIAVSLRQRVTPGRLLGRLNSCYRFVGWGARPLGALAGGVLADLVGLRGVFVILAAGILCLFAGMRVVTDERIAEAERAVEPA